MSEHAVRLHDLDRVGRLPTCATLIEIVVAGQDAGAAEVVTIDGSDCVVLTGDAQTVSRLIAALLDERVRVYERAHNAAAWKTTDTAPVIVEQAEEPEEQDLAVMEDDWPRIDPEFATLCGMLTAEQLEGLRASIVEKGCREKLVVWAETDILLDGHNRLAVCRDLRVRFDVIEYSFKDRTAARNWIIDNALARRSLTPQQEQYLRGKRQIAEAQDKTDNLRRGSKSPKPQNEASGKRACRVASASGVSRATVERNAAYARAVDRIADTAGQRARAAILSGEVKLTQAQVLVAAERGPKTVAQLLEIKRALMPVLDAASPCAHVDRLARQLEHAIADARASITRSEPASLWRLRDALNGLHAAVGRDAAGQGAA